MEKDYTWRVFSDGLERVSQNCKRLERRRTTNGGMITHVQINEILKSHVKKTKGWQVEFLDKVPDRIPLGIGKQEHPLVGDSH